MPATPPFGFLPSRDAPGSTPMIAVQFVTRFDCDWFLWRRNRIAPQPDDSFRCVSTNHLPQSPPAQRMTLKKSIRNHFPRPNWLSFPTKKRLDWTKLSRSHGLPRVTSRRSVTPMTATQLSTDSFDLTTRTYHFSKYRRWKYEGIANQQVLVVDSVRSKTAPQSTRSWLRFVPLTTVISHPRRPASETSASPSCMRPILHLVVSNFVSRLC